MNELIPELPEGPVTMMFTDLEGSTALRTKLGDAKSDALLRQHDELIRHEIEINKGQDQKAALGDGFLAVFASTRRALSCAIGIQRAMDSFNLQSSEPPLRVRIGLNTGEVTWQDAQLSGEAVHAAARVCAEGSGGQILVSDVTRQLAGTIPGITFHDAGEHQLKGFPEPWRLWEVVWVRETTHVPQQVFVGRDHELAVLRSKLASALDGHGSLVLVGGEPGVGKTTLVRQLIREAEQRGALAVFGRCYEAEGALPFSPFVEMLEQALAIMPPEIVREDMGEDAPEVARLVPELRRRFPDIGEPLELPPEQQRHYFFKAVGSFVRRGSTRFPLMLVIDDVHWADEPTLLLIEHMASLIPQMRVLGVGTYRDVELDVSRPLAATIERLLRARAVERLPVKRFDRDGVGAMLGALAGKPAPDALVEVIFAETEGNPFFVEEVFRHFVEERKLFDENGAFRTDLEVDELDVPESVRLVVGRRLERLGPESQKVLAAGAVVGRGFPFALLEAITDIDGGTLLDIVEQAEAARVIVPEERDGYVHYTFAHELIRQTLLAGLSLLRRQRLHLRVADAIEQTDRDARQSRPSEIAHHLLEAGAAAGIQRTLDYLQQAADRAMEQAAFEEALRAIDDALTVVDPSDLARRAGLIERRGWAVRALGGFEESNEIWRDVIPLYQQIGDKEAAARLCYETGYQLIWLNRFEEAFATYARGVEIVGDERSPVRAMLIGASATLLGFGGFVEEGEPLFVEAEAIARELGDERTLGRTLWGRTVVNWSNGRIPEAIESGRSSIELLRRANDLWYLADALCWTAFPLAMAGSPAEARQLAEEGVELGKKFGHQGAEILSRRGVLLSSILSDADLEEFERLAHYDLERMEAIHSPWVSQSHAWIASALLLRGRLDDSLHHANRAIELEPTSAWSGIGWCYKFLNRAYAQDVNGCRSLLAEVTLGEAKAMGATAMLVAGAHGCVVAGLEEEAAALYPLVAESADRIPISVFDVVLTHRVAGMSAAAAGRWHDAQRHFEVALRQSDELPDRIEEPQVQHWFGKMLAERGDDRAREMLASARSGYERLGMPLHQAMVQALLDDSL